MRTDILARYVKYLTSLRSSPSMEVVVLANLVARDVRSTTGANLHFVREMSGLDLWSCRPRDVKKVMSVKLAELPDQDKWWMPYLAVLLEERREGFNNKM